MAVILIILFIFIAIPVFITFLVYILFGDSSNSSRNASLSYSSNSDDEISDYERDSTKNSSFHKFNSKKSSHDDPYDFGPDVSSEKMYEHAEWLMENDPESYEELGLGDY